MLRNLLDSVLTLQLGFIDNHTQFNLTNCDSFHFRGSVIDGKSIGLGCRDLSFSLDFLCFNLGQVNSAFWASVSFSLEGKKYNSSCKPHRMAVRIIKRMCLWSNVMYANVTLSFHSHIYLLTSIWGLLWIVYVG